MSAPRELTSQIDKLATQVVVHGAEGDVDTALASLQQIREVAIRLNAHPVAAAAAEILNSLSGERGEAVSASLLEGIARLQDLAVLDEKEPQNTPQSAAQDHELLSDFIVESREYLTTIESQVLTLERNPRDSEALNAVFRGFHTIKGLAGFLELWDIQKLSHEVEAILDRARNQQLIVTAPVIDAILQSSDYLQRWLTHLEGVLQGQPAVQPPWNEEFFVLVRGLGSSPETGVPSVASMAGVLLQANTPTEPVAEHTAPNPAEKKRGESLAVKVDTSKLDYLVDMAGEMVIAESLVRHDPELQNLKTPKLLRNLAQLSRITTELQKTAMAMRLVPIGSIFRRMARLIRDLSLQFGKQVRMETDGDEIELDRTIVEALADPLMHMVRNAIDHGIEPADERVSQQKPATARVLLRAQHQAGHVLIEISDDGRGLDRKRIEAKAVERGLITSAEAMTDGQVFDLIFEPGFSTAAAVTNVSGRGVGMDVVRRHVEKLRGRIEIQSVPGQGSRFLLKLPLTLAIIDGLVVGVGEERYIVPLFAVREMFRPSEGTLWTVQGQSEMALVRDALLPVIRLYERFGVEPRSRNPRESVLIVAESEAKRYCLLVDNLIGKQEVVIKSLGETFKNVSGVAGGAILGDGRVGLILELDRLFKDRALDASR